MVIQIVDLHNLLEDLLKILPNLRDRPGYDGKAPLVPGDILVDQAAGLAVVKDAQLLLLLVKLQGLRAALGKEGLLPKDFHDRRPRVDGRQLLILLVRSVKNRKTPLHQLPVQIEGAVLLVVEDILLAGRSAAVPGISLGPAVQAVARLPVEDARKAHVLKLGNGRAHHPLKAQGITDVDRLFLSQIDPGVHKAQPVAFREGGRHGVDPLLRQPRQEAACLQFIF